MNDTFKSKLAKLIDLKSIITVMLVANLIFLVDYIMVTGATIDEKIFLLFSNIVTMVVTYYFTRKSTGGANHD